VTLLWIILAAFGYLPRRQAVAHAAWALGWMAAMFALQPGWPNPFGFAVFLGGTLVVTAWFVNKLVARAETYAEAEHAMRIELDALNRTLEARVDEQVDELSRLDRLRRFLSPSVAEAVVSTEGLTRLAPHRALIAALFCDLRGFTAFSSEAEPEDVTALLGRFHDVIGPLVDRYEATVGGFAGDGVALYFNDPIPCADPAVQAVRLALDLEAPMTQLAGEWRRHGFEVGYGVGIALGYATLGVIGIEHRREYTAIGSVMNLASRLSDEAGPAEILLDSRAAAAVHDQINTAPLDDLQLKGFARPVAAYRVVGHSATSSERVE
jgi:class 3 adenylate cyclase